MRKSESLTTDELRAQLEDRDHDQTPEELRTTINDRETELTRKEMLGYYLVILLAVCIAGIVIHVTGNPVL